MPEMDTALRRWRGRLVLWVVLPYATLVAFYLVVFCVQIRSINDAVCFFNKRVLNAMMMFLDRRHWYAAVLRHKGRHSRNGGARRRRIRHYSLLQGKSSTGSRIFGSPRSTVTPTTTITTTRLARSGVSS